MKKIFPDIIANLPEADIPVEGLQAFLFQGENQQLIFMSFEKDVEIPEHLHKAQWGAVRSYSVLARRYCVAGGSLEGWPALAGGYIMIRWMLSVALLLFLSASPGSAQGGPGLGLGAGGGIAEVLGLTAEQVEQLTAGSKGAGRALHLKDDGEARPR